MPSIETTHTVNNSGQRPTKSAPVWPYVAADVVLVILFAAIGRSSHGEGLAGTALTAWPFLVGAAVGWLLSRAWRAPASLAPSGVTIWLATVIVGMLLRAATGSGTHWSFIVVATIANAVFLLGYRMLARLAAKISQRRS
ncbi:MAG: DUF3054 domain-containing protein [Kocuria sp.]|jgi:peptidoglycan/LPS O-acetylase OafA/YrhL|nr:DUF3054 domain-containing protein [Kocuria sp.]MDN5617764.1 DUF3054 domain-containing protein [Kocuria sp.]MDN5653945.1 DUF3054 domain-containing protein [Kocuria sp.]